MGETILQNEREVEVLAGELGFKQVIHLGYRNHFLDEAAPTELRARLVFLIRALKIDTITTFSPWGHWEENPDHYITGQAVEAARWMAGMGKDYPEQLACGMQPHSVGDLYYWAMRPGQPYNTVVDIADYLDEKVASMSANKAQGPAGAPRPPPQGTAGTSRQVPARLGPTTMKRPTASTSASLACKNTNASASPMAWTTPRRSTICRPAETFTGAMSAAEIERYIADHAEDLG